MIRSMEGFIFASVLDLIMDYYHIKVDDNAQNLFRIVFLWHMVKFKYKRLPMGIKIAWILMRKTFKTYLNDFLILLSRSFKDHLLKLEMVLARLSTAGMQFNISKSKFFAEQIKYLGYWITRQGIPIISNKAEMNAILIIKDPKTRKELPTTPVYWYSQLLTRHVVLQI
jgi:hypothetical protein